jgi:hypothetical protein
LDIFLGLYFKGLRLKKDEKKKRKEEKKSAILWANQCF